jgi:hypothetical protein
MGIGELVAWDGGWRGRVGRALNEMCLEVDVDFGGICCFCSGGDWWALGRGFG